MHKNMDFEMHHYRLYDKIFLKNWQKCNACHHGNVLQLSKGHQVFILFIFSNYYYYYYYYCYYK